MMNGDQAKKLNGTINRSSAISIGVVVMIIGATVWFVSNTTSLQAKVESISDEVSTLDDDFVPRRELNERLMNIESAVLRIENYVK